jgi:hypothetical protein
MDLRASKFELLKRKRAESQELNKKAVKNQQPSNQNPSQKQERKRKMAEG